MKNIFKPLLLVLGSALSLYAALPLAAQPQTFSTNDGTALFFADHSLGEVDGTLNPVTGTLTFDPASPTDGLSGQFTVDMASFDSGIGLRDRDMRKKYLHTDEYPEATFVFQDALPTLIGSDSGPTFQLALTGAMTLHGVTRDHTVEATLTPTAEGYQVQATFRLLMTDYGMKPPKRFMLKVKDEIRVEVDVNLIKKP